MKSYSPPPPKITSKKDSTNGNLKGCENVLISEEQQRKIDEVRRSIGPFPFKLSIYWSDASISRYLRAQNWNVNKATLKLKETLKWRLEYNPEAIRWNSKSIEAQTRYFVYCMENAIMNLPENQEEVIWLVDFHGFNLSDTSIKLTKETMHVLQDYYPQRLGIVILYNPPKFFQPFWMLAKSFLETRTINKVKFVYSDDPNTKKIMEEIFEMDQLESTFGGEDNASFDIIKYGERMREEDKRMQSLRARSNASGDMKEKADKPSSRNGEIEVRLPG
ncbi:hypothetical protein U1Q18_037614 [Sarracenia purpurea var. burkii]